MKRILLSTVESKTLVPSLFGLIQLSPDIGRGGAKYHTITGNGGKIPQY